MVRDRDCRQFRNVGFRWPRYHDSDHRAVVATIKSGRRRLKEYRRKRQEFPLHLPPVEQQDDLTRAFEALKVTCEEPETMKAHWRDWMSDSTWLLIKQRTSLRRAGRLHQLEGRRMRRAIYAALKRDRAARTAQVGELIVSELAKGNVHEAFRHLKGWYRRPRKHRRGLVSRPWNGRHRNALSSTSGATCLAYPSLSAMQRCVPTSGTTFPRRRKYESRSKS
jgi:hypothetical protein